MGYEDIYKINNITNPLVQRTCFTHESSVTHVTFIVTRVKLRLSLHNDSCYRFHVCLPVNTVVVIWEI